MKPIQHSLQKWIQNNESFQERHNAMKREITSHPLVRSFLQAHEEITDEQIDRNLNKLYEYITQSHQCDRCTSVETCKNMLQGYSPILEYKNEEIHISYEKCRNRLAEEAQTEQSDLIKSVHIPKEILEARIDKVHVDQERTNAIKSMTQFLNAAEEKLPERGIYFSGPFGVGKTYLLGVIANRLKQFNISSMLIYMPEFVREMNASIKDNTVQQKVDAFKKADVLMLDDIGAETLSAWFRDEVLGAILQYRMMEKLPVFFTSNYTMDQLEEILATTTRGDVEKVKAGRIMERIKQVSIEVPVNGKNRRR
ncbi:primosomal protein DnaI [Pseudogracilibacillus sp. ICA-222130]|uniref:primosomal protein DnaI n=1 Tax=Pseudogracilibacillus sp. ICA-222130 TaxID=3134655 RepID=UPI0030BA6BA6